MIVTGAAASVYVRATARQRPRVELLSPSNGLSWEGRPERHPGGVNRHAGDWAPPCHSATAHQAGPLQEPLSSAFVAQILGQGLVTKTKPADAERAHRAYAQAGREAPAARLLRLA